MRRPTFVECIPAAAIAAFVGAWQATVPSEPAPILAACDTATCSVTIAPAKGDKRPPAVATEPATAPIVPAEPSTIAPSAVPIVETAVPSPAVGSPAKQAPNGKRHGPHKKLQPPAANPARAEHCIPFCLK